MPTLIADAHKLLLAKYWINSGNLEELKRVEGLDSVINKIIPNEKGPGRTLISFACESGNKEIVEYLLHNYPTLDYNDGGGCCGGCNCNKRPIDITIRKKHVEIMKLLWNLRNIHLPSDENILACGIDIDLIVKRYPHVKNELITLYTLPKQFRQLSLQNSDLTVKAILSDQCDLILQNPLTRFISLHHYINYNMSFIISSNVKNRNFLEMANDGTFNGSLSQFTTTDTGPKQLFELLFSFIKVAGTMKYLHDRNVVYLDINPSNIFTKICFIDEVNEAIGDITLADVYRKIDDPKSFENTDTLYYSAPELNNRENTELLASDVFSFGATMQALLSGFRPSASDRFDSFIGFKTLYERFQSCLNLSQAMKINALGMRCVSFDPFERPTFNQIFDELVEITLDIYSPYLGITKTKDLGYFINNLKGRTKSFVDIHFLKD